MAASLIVFAREPTSGRVKTRLAGRLGKDGAARLYRAFVQDTLAALAGHGGFFLTVATDPAPEKAPFLCEQARRAGADTISQETGDLGERMANALRTALEGGAGAALLIGTDFPTLPPTHLDEAATLLEGADAVFGPSNDGGYYLAGASARALKRWDEVRERLFSGITWSTAHVLRDTLARAGDLNVVLAPCWYDVDDPHDLDTLIRHLRRPRPPSVPETAKILEELGCL